MPHYFAPFGRYEARRSAEYPANEVLVGREKPRAEFLKHLFAAGRRGAYLITGHRGSGKTSFVEHCLNEYEDDVYQRFLQRNVGRAFLWDRAGQFLLLAVVLFAGLLMSQLTRELFHQPRPVFLVLPLLAVLLAALAYSLVAATRLFHVAVVEPGSVLSGRAAGSESHRLGRHPQVMITILVAGLVGLMAIGLPLASPAVALTQQLLVLAMLYGVTIVVSSLRAPTDSEASAAPSSRHDWPSEDPAVGTGRDGWVERPWRRWTPTIVLLLLEASIGFWARPESLGDIKGDQVYALFYFGLALMVLSTGASLRSLLQGGLEGRSGGATDAALASSRRWHLFAGAALFIIALLMMSLAIFLGELTLEWVAMVVVVTAALAALGAFLVAFLAALLGRGCRRQVYPKPRLLLGFKGFMHAVVGCQLLYPLLEAAVRLSGQPRARVEWANSFSLLAAAQSNTPVFSDLSDDFAWVVAAALLAIITSSIEFDWIVRPFSRLREDFSLHRSLHEGRLPAMSGQRNVSRIWARETFFWKVYAEWLPVLRIPINLGFDLLDQRLVVESMLAGLRNAYRHKFLHWNRPATMARRLLTVGALLLLSIHVGSLVFGLDQPLSQALARRNLCDLLVRPPRSEVEASWRGFNSNQVVPHGSLPSKIAPWLTCRIGGETAVQVVYWAMVEPPSGTASGLRTVPELARPPEPVGNVNTLQRLTNLSTAGHRHPLEIPLHVFVLYGIFAWIVYKLSTKFGIPPYREMDGRMGEMLDGLSRTLREEVRPQISPLSMWLGAITGRETVHQKEGGPFDPRTVELQFLGILDDIQTPGSQMPFGSIRRISPPIPEVIFVFDELDKIGGGKIGEAAGPEQADREPLDQERDRSGALHNLFADLKNTISSGRARFIFIGGRNLHDEWLADQMARRPLLSHIFDLELYIPSLLTDVLTRQPAGDESEKESVCVAAEEGEAPNAADLQAIRGLVSRLLFRAETLYRLSRLKRLRPWLTLWVERPERLSFVQIGYEKDGTDSRQEWPHLDFFSDDRTGIERIVERPENEETTAFERDLFRFLAYRSRGNVKRLIDLIESFLEPSTARAGAPRLLKQGGKKIPWSHHCDHMLAFGELDQYRIQLVADLYRQLLPVLEMRVGLRDDKMPHAILYLADFLLKFHRRAFAWSNIERVDELVHIHRAPDLRLAVQNILTLWNDRFLHRIRNGMYDFRCTSEFGRELEFISRASDEELAALNFTLDESQFLKAIYRSRVEVLGDQAGNDFVAGLAELHKFDEEYELARSYLRRAIANLDDRFRREMRSSTTRNPVQQVFGRGETEDYATLRSRLGWGISRLRLMMQVGMTYERSRNLEFAQVEYREARSLAESLIAALSGWCENARGTSRSARHGLPVPTFGQSTDHDVEFVDTLKHMNVLFQPLLAEAWVVEKLGSGGDSAAALIETGLWVLRQSLPFVQSVGFASEPTAKHPLDIQHANFALIAAEMHNKAGDLMFYKGRQLVSEELTKKFILGRKSGAEGYLVRALYHYTVSLHDLRRYVVYRRANSAVRFGPPSGFDSKVSAGTAEGERRTIEDKGWPDFVFRVAAGSLADLADTLFARFSYTRLIGAFMNPQPPKTDRPEVPVADSTLDAEECFMKWMETPGGELSPFKEDWSAAVKQVFPGCSADLDCRIDDWLAAPASSPPAAPGSLIHQSTTNSELERMIHSLAFSFVAARLLERGCYWEAAGKQYLRTAWQVTHLLWWGHGLRALYRRFKEKWKFLERILGDEAERSPVWQSFVADVCGLAVKSLEKSVEVLRLAGRGAPDQGAVPPEIQIAACALGLALDLEKSETAALRVRLRRLLPKRKTTASVPDGAHFVATLDDLLRTRQYPILDRLHMLKVRIDHTILSRVATGEDRCPLDESTERRLKELLRVRARYGSVFHFTPFEVGFTLSLVCCLCEEVTDGPTWRLEAIRALAHSQHMYTQQSGYYEAISELYYLYDDFNDRAIHCNHALQMAAAEVSTFLRRNLEDQEQAFLWPDDRIRDRVDASHQEIEGRSR